MVGRRYSKGRGRREGEGRGRREGEGRGRREGEGRGRREGEGRGRREGEELCNRLSHTTTLIYNSVILYQLQKNSLQAMNHGHYYNYSAPLIIIAQQVCTYYRVSAMTKFITTKIHNNQFVYCTYMN